MTLARYRSISNACAERIAPKPASRSAPVEYRPASHVDPEHMQLTVVELFGLMALQMWAESGGDLSLFPRSRSVHPAAPSLESTRA